LSFGKEERGRRSLSREKVRFLSDKKALCPGLPSYAQPEDYVEGGS
jgi:hypothetical protein